MGVVNSGLSNIGPQSDKKFILIGELVGGIIRNRFLGGKGDLGSGTGSELAFWNLQVDKVHPNSPFLSIDGHFGADVPLRGVEPGQRVFGLEDHLERTEEGFIISLQPLFHFMGTGGRNQGPEKKN
jgi:hypothetical protein